MSKYTSAFMAKESFDLLRISRADANVIRNMIKSGESVSVAISKSSLTEKKKTMMRSYIDKYGEAVTRCYLGEVGNNIEIR